MTIPAAQTLGIWFVHFRVCVNPCGGRLARHKDIEYHQRMFEKVFDSVLGRPIRMMKTPKPSIFLTFDDGPEPGMTQKVLDKLESFGAKGTFFVIAEKAKKHAQLLREIENRGHSIGNHSLDHIFSRYLNGYASMKKWVQESEDMIANALGKPTIGFRPPWGMRTPALKSVLHELKMPLILWNTRFYDAVYEWTPERALASLKRAQSGSIVLLHDRQPPERLDGFLHTLHAYVDEATKRRYELPCLTRELTTRKI